MSTDDTYGSAFPKPPDIYKEFEDGTLTSASPNHTIAKAVDNPIPPAPTLADEYYTSFGDLWPVNEKLPTLADMGVLSLIPKSMVDRGVELTKLADSLLLNYLELVDILVTNPIQFAGKVDHLRLILVNMHYLINEYRPHQARETLKLLLSDQLFRRKEETASIRRECVELKMLLADLQDIKATNLDESSDEPPDESSINKADYVGRCHTWKTVIEDNLGW